MKIYNDIPDEIEDSTAPWDSVFSEDFHVAIYHDKYPCTAGHLLFVPKHNTISVLSDAFEDALRFAVETVFYPSPFGIHAPWKNLSFEEMEQLTDAYPAIHELIRLQY